MGVRVARLTERLLPHRRLLVLVRVLEMGLEEVALHLLREQLWVVLWAVSLA